MIRDLYQGLKNIYHFAQAHLWRALNGFPDRQLHLYAVTGTNGKTTTCYLLTSILAAAYGPDKVGMLTTVAMRIGEREEINKTKMTTTNSRQVYTYLKRMKDAGVTHVVLELTSHALHQHRVAGIRLDGAIITNLAREHLDYHKTIDRYAAAKRLIINYLKPRATLVGKGDDAYVGPMLDEAARRGFPIRRFTAADAQPITTPLLGDVNKQNVLAARLLAEASGVPPTAITAGVAALTHVPGRMEWIDAPAGWRAIIDYAVTPDALEYLYRYVRANSTGKIYAILGACGRRDRGKRPDMARTVAQFADELIITNEDPWDEPEEQIFSDLEKGLTDTTTKWQRIPDRRAALQYAISQAQAGDVIVVTGKGAERGMAFADRIIPWNEREVIEGLMRENEK